MPNTSPDYRAPSLPSPRGVSFSGPNATGCERSTAARLIRGAENEKAARAGASASNAGRAGAAAGAEEKTPRAQRSRRHSTVASPARRSFKELSAPARRRVAVASALWRAAFPPPFPAPSAAHPDARGITGTRTRTFSLALPLWGKWRRPHRPRPRLSPPRQAFVGTAPAGDGGPADRRHRPSHRCCCRGRPEGSLGLTSERRAPTCSAESSSRANSPVGTRQNRAFSACPVSVLHI